MMSREGTTQGNPLAMAMYAIGTQPLIHRLSGIAKQVWYADDSAAGGGLANLHMCLQAIRIVTVMWAKLHPTIGN